MINRVAYYQKWALFAVIFLLVVPIEFPKFEIQASGLPFAILILPFAIVIALMANTKEATLFKLAFLISLIAIIATQLFNYTFSVRPFLSLLYFFSPVCCYFLAIKLISTQEKMEFFLSWGLVFSCLLAISVLGSIFIQHDGQVRADGILSGTYFGMPLSGAYGVHSLVAHYLVIMLLVYLNLDKTKKINKMKEKFCYITLLIFLYVLVFSLSREIVLALLIIVLGYMMRAYGVLRAALILIGLFLFFYINAELILSSVMEAWATKLASSLSATDYESLSSGRGTLQLLAMEQILSRPLTGTGFYGYALDHDSFGDYDDLSGWTPHNYYLTVVWKMGIFGAGFYFLFWFFALKKLNSSLLYVSKKSAILINFFLFSFLFCVNMLWDALLAPSVMCLFSFLVGALVASKKLNSAFGRAKDPDRRY